MTSSERLTFVVPGDDPPQIQGSPHLERLKPYGDVALHTGRPASMDELIERARDAEVVLNTRGAIKWPRDAIQALPKLKLIATCSIGSYRDTFVNFTVSCIAHRMTVDCEPRLLGIS